MEFKIAAAIPTALRSLLVVVGLLCADLTAASSPTISFAPNPIALGTSGCSAGTTCATLTATPTIPGNCVASDAVQVSCTEFSHTGAISVSVSPSFYTQGCISAAPVDIAVSCTPAAADASFTLDCKVLRTTPPLSTSDTYISGSCPALAHPEFDSTPAAGSSIPLAAAVGASATANLRVSNVAPGQAALSVIASGLSGVLAISPSSPQSIPPPPSGSNFRDYTLTCAPVAAGTTVTQTLSLDTNDTDEGRLDYTVTCTAPAAPQPEFTATPPPPTLPQIITDRPASGSTTITVRNDGTGTLSIGSISGLAPPFSIAPASADIAAGQSRLFTLSCSGAQAGSYSRFFAFNTNDANEGSVQYQATCRVQAPEIDTVPAAGSAIGMATTQGTPVSRSITVSNLSPPADATLQVISVTGLSGRLSLASPSSFSVPAGGSGTVVIQCDAATAGSAAQNLFINSNDEDEPTQSFPVSCDVSAATAPELSPSVVPPGPIAIATAQGSNASRTLTVQNVGSSNLTVQVSTNPAGPKISLSPNAAAGVISLAPNQSQLFTVGCDAATSGSFSDLFRITTNDSDEGLVTFNVTCSVSATAPEFTSIPPAPGSFGITTPQGSNASTSFTVRNDGSAPLTIGSISGATAPISVSPPSAAIAAGGSQVFTIACDAGTGGAYSRGFTLNSNDADEGAVAYTVDCLVTTGAAQFDSTPAVNSTIALTSPVGVAAHATLVIRNLAASGEGDLVLSTAGLMPPLSTTLSSATIAAGGSASFSIDCTPTDGEEIAQNLSLATSDGLNDPAEYVVDCRGLVPTYESAPEPGNDLSMTVSSGSGAASVDLVVSNTGEATLNVTAAGLSAPLSIAPGMASIAPGGSQTFALSCASTVVGSINQVLSLSSNDLNFNPATYTVYCDAGSLPTLSFEARAYLAAQARPRRNLLFKNDFE